MKPEYAKYKELRLLIFELIDGSITQERMAELNKILANDSGAVDYYVDFLEIQVITKSCMSSNSNESYLLNCQESLELKDLWEDLKQKNLTEIDAGDIKPSNDSNTSLRGVDLVELQFDADDSDESSDLLEILELVRSSPAVEIEKPKSAKPKRELIQKVVRPAREKRNLTKFQKFFLTASAAAVLFFVFLVKFSPESVPSVAVATVSDQMNVKWAQSRFSLETGDRLWTKDFPLDIKKGIVSIEFDEGVEVVVEGPAFFEIERKGIYLEYGRLYGKVSEMGQGFTVKTPTSQFIDLGTEFGVLSDINGSSELHVTKGKVQMIAGLKGEPLVSQIVTENRAAKFNAVKGSVKHIKIKRKAFVRNIDSKSDFIWKGQAKIDLADIFGGGNGFGSGKTDVSLDVRSGKLTSLAEGGGKFDTKSKEPPAKTFVTVDQSPYIDSVFMPDGGDGRVQVSSAGHIFDDCPDTSGWIDDSNIINGDTLLGKKQWSVQLGNVRYGTKENPAITMRANRGITFDLEAIRSSMGVTEFERFTAKCGVNWKGQESEGEVNIHVLVDGQARFNSTEKEKISEPSNVDVYLDRDDRFLTLVVTKKDKSGKGTWMVIAEPVLHIGD